MAKSKIKLPLVLATSIYFAILSSIFQPANCQRVTTPSIITRTAVTLRQPITSSTTNLRLSTTTQRSNVGRPRKPDPPQFHEKLGRINESDFKSLTCISKNGLPPPTFQWFIDDLALNSSYLGPTTQTIDANGTTLSYYQHLVNYQFTWKDDGKSVRCRVFNALNSKSPDVVSAPISVNYPPKAQESTLYLHLQQFGAEGVISIIVFTTEAPTCSWTMKAQKSNATFKPTKQKMEARSGNRIEQNNKELKKTVYFCDLHIESVTDEDLQATYRLTAKNEFGTSEFDAALPSNLNSTKIDTKRENRTSTELKPALNFKRDEHVTLISNTALESKISQFFPPLSKAWRYLKGAYPNGLKNAASHLYVTFDDPGHIQGHRKAKGQGDSCKITHFKPTYSNHSNQTIFNAIKCHPQLVNTTEIEGLLLNSMATIVTASFKMNSEKDDLALQSASLLAKAIFFDLCIKLGRFKEARSKLRLEPKEKTVLKKPIVQNPNVFQEVSVPLYAHFGGVALWDRFIVHANAFHHIKNSAMKNNSTKNESKTVKNIPIKNPHGIGTMVHLLSGAADRNLRDHAIKTKGIGWNEEFQKEFNFARKTMPLNYTCISCDKLPIIKTPPSIKKGSGGQNLIIIVVAAIAALILVIAIIVIIIVIKRRTNKSKGHGSTNQYGQNGSRNLTVGEINEFFDGNQKISEKDKDAKAVIQRMPFNNNFEIPKKRIHIDGTKILAKTGRFSVLLRGLRKGDEKISNLETEIAVLTVEPDIDTMLFKALLLDVKTMASVGRHLNIVTVLGTVTENIKKREVFVALEHCAQGDLLKHLSTHREKFVDLWSRKNSAEFNVLYTSVKRASVSFVPRTERVSISLQQLSTIDLLDWSEQIAEGMEYLTSKNIVHGNLSAQNVMLTARNVAKIYNFGLARNSLYLSNKSNDDIPWRWLSMESLTDEAFSVHSDVWSFGVTLWEIFTLGQVPYLRKKWDRLFVCELVAGERLSAPEYGNGYTHNLMLNCMKKVPKERVTFTQIKCLLDSIKANLESSSSATPEPSNL